MVAQQFLAFWADLKASGKVTDVLGWYQERKQQFPMLTQFAAMIFSIPTSQAKNYRRFSLSGVFTLSNRARMSVDML